MTETLAPLGAAHKTLTALDLVPNPHNLRADEDYGDIVELARSISSLGLLQPIVAGPTNADNQHQIIAGHRRHRAIHFAINQRWITPSFAIDVMVRDMTSEAASSLAALLENLQRQDVNIVDECLAVAKICGKHGYSRKDLAANTGKSATWISTRLKLAGLPDLALERVRTGLLRVETAMELAKLPAADRVALAESNEWEIKQKIRKNNAAKQFDAFMAALDAAGVAEKFRHVSDHKARAEHRRHCRMTDPKDVAEEVIHVRPMKTADLFYWDEHVGLSLYRHDSHFTDDGGSKTSPAPQGVEPAAWTAYRESLDARRTWVSERAALVKELRLAAVAALTDKEVLALALKYMVLAVLEVTEYSYSNLIVTEAEASAFGIDQGAALIEYDRGSDDPEYMAWAHEQATSKATMIPWLRVELCRTAFEADIPVEAAADAAMGEQPTEVPVPIKEKSPA
jgi:ParB/RepB/Spo0J family partition protein